MAVNVLITIGLWWVWCVSRGVSYKVQKSTFLRLPRWLGGFAVNIHWFFPLAKFNVKELSAFRNHLQMAFQTHQTHQNNEGVL